MASKYRALALGIVGLLAVLPTNAQISKKQEKINAQHADAIAAARPRLRSG